MIKRNYFYYVTKNNSKASHCGLWTRVSWIGDVDIVALGINDYICMMWGCTTSDITIKSFNRV